MGLRESAPVEFEAACDGAGGGVLLPLPALLATLRQDLVPFLEAHALVSAEQRRQLEEDPLQHRFTLVFDREAYSPEFFREMKAKRIAILTYHKFPDENWLREGFTEQTVCLGGGETITMRLAEPATMLRGKLWLREIRKLSENGQLQRQHTLFGQLGLKEPLSEADRPTHARLYSNSTRSGVQRLEAAALLGIPEENRQAMARNDDPGSFIWIPCGTGVGCSHFEYCQHCHSHRGIRRFSFTTQKR